MDYYTALQAAADAEGATLAQVCRDIGRAPSYINSAIARGSDPSTANAAAMLGAVGWRLVAVPAADVPPSALAIDPPAADGEAERRALERRRDRLRRELAATEEMLG
ncbi:hypothetical protein [Adlercreutzia caecimuris]|uniref:XRE family transcriptional regulator n=1 Tax=Adlercreutzia caecimuris TaxID=671266 RepID=A0A4S4G228_9ACTN|nr:hypothetical protein [Adlercreutzia caecimuris]THG36848.1 hypothetical protein E5986_08075 [Adlercreutzia caecimuris]